MRKLLLFLLLGGESENKFSLCVLFPAILEWWDLPDGRPQNIVEIRR